ncbi:MAG: 6-hydroxymethylpterin diphosphokinase MptE-like protein [Phycisphaerales bacterium JB037]
MIPDTPIPANPDLLSANLRALAARSPRAAERIAHAAPRTDLQFSRADDGLITARDGSGRQLASRRRPGVEAERFAAGIDLQAAGVLAITGFGLGHHLRALSERTAQYSVLAVFEPDVALLRAVFERIDLTPMLARTPMVLVTEPDDSPALAAGLAGLEGLVALGVRLAAHPPSEARIAAGSGAFAETVTRVVRAMRTSITTTLVQSTITLRNLLMNADHYATRPGIADLVGSLAGRPAVCVAAGPSLQRNIDHLARPGVRDRVVIIAAQTVLKPLLARGIRPHFVTALDHHEISRRFFEGLTADEVRGVTLVAEPMVSPAVLEAFPGAVRLVSDHRLDAICADDPLLGRERGELEPGATVAHLSYELARALGCDPVVLVGQDLGFTDGQYYAAGASIHRVWAPELNPFRTLEMFEHERIVRMRHLLTRTTDLLGRPIYTDEQMHSYLTQFEQMFARDAARSLSTIDATEGGVRKAHTTIATLAETLAPFASLDPIAWPETPEPPARARSIEALRERLRSVRRQAWRIGRLCRETADLLDAMLTHHGDHRRVNELIRKTEPLRAELDTLEPGYTLTRFLNQAGALNRVRADRSLALQETEDKLERQRAQIERDQRNVSWIGDASDELGRLLDDAIRMLGGGPRLTRDRADDADARPTPASAAPRRRRVVALVRADLDRSGIGSARDLTLAIRGEASILAHTLDRLDRCRELDDIAIVTDQPERVRTLLGGRPERLGVRIIEASRGRLDDAFAAARAAGPNSWRGSLANLTCYDEVATLPLIARTLGDLDADAAALVGGDWTLVHPALVDETVARYREATERHPLTFSQAAPGLGTCVVDRTLAGSLGSQIAGAGPLASIGGTLGYHPSSPRSDPIAKSHCVQVPPSVRDLAMRVVADAPRRVRAIASFLDRFGRELDAMGPERLARALASHAAGLAQSVPTHLELELCTGRVSSGVRSSWLRGIAEPPERAPISMEDAERAIADAADLSPDLFVTLGGAGDPLAHPRWRDIARLAARNAAAVHLRTDLLANAETLASLARAPIDIISVDLLADSRETYAAITGADRFDEVLANLQGLIEQSRRGGFGTPWIVPRITRCDATLGEIEAFYDRWLSRCGACVIDALPRPIFGERIAPLPLPAGVRPGRGLIRVQSDGFVVGDAIAEPLGPISAEPIESLWRAIRPGTDATTTQEHAA